MKAIAALWARALVAVAAGTMVIAAPAAAQQMETVDPSAIDADLEEQPGEPPVYGEPAPPTNTGTASDEEVAPNWSDPSSTAPATSVPASEAPATAEAQASRAAAEPSDTYKSDDLIGAAEGLFGKGAEGVARMIQDLLAKQGEPNAYIVGREASGAFIFGARYGSGTLFHKVEGQKPVYWTGPSIGFDAGANAGNTFILVYNLYDSEDLYERFPAGEGQAYVIGGLTASYMRKGDVVLIPIRVGAGLRLGINAGYMKFSKKQRWLPF
ncbi:DUF1134 domain-containing protein [Erythrobacter sp. 3-20A1M]|uniref:DUF1134 domain-containing protein n=1 Tax=Erythrobacter sp. 3-20A1M TaxID=2653850 RepID=UPI001BFC09CC|nr:DUF1134 domain-containing protein [Erythrobacter sp. 3-20A1M]